MNPIVREVLIKEFPDIEFKDEMTQAEKNALAVHNSIFVKKAMELRVYDSYKSFVVIYEDRTFKYGFECGCHIDEIRQLLY